MQCKNAPLMPSLAGNRNEWLQAFEFYFIKRSLMQLV